MQSLASSRHGIACAGASTRPSRRIISVLAISAPNKQHGASKPGPGGKDAAGQKQASPPQKSAPAATGLVTLTFQTPKGTMVVKAKPGSNLYNAADVAGVHMPASCKQGSCTSCAAKVLEGSVRHSHEPACLTAKTKAEGYITPCCAVVTGDATILTHQGSKLRVERAAEEDRMKHRHG